jgi:hypothetical protein
MSPVRYELGSYIPEDGTLYSDRCERLKSYINSTTGDSFPAHIQPGITGMRCLQQNLLFGWRKPVVAWQKHYSRIWLEKMRKIMVNIRTDKRCSGPDSKWGPSVGTAVFCLQESKATPWDHRYLCRRHEHSSTPCTTVRPVISNTTSKGELVRWELHYRRGNSGSSRDVS